MFRQMTLMMPFLFIFRLCFTPFQPPGALPLLSGRQKGISGQVVSHVPQTDFGPDSDNANAPHHRTSGTHRHDAKHMLNAATDSRSASVTLLFSGRQLLMPTALALNMLAKALFFKRLQGFDGFRQTPDNYDSSSVMRDIAEIFRFFFVS